MCPWIYNHQQWTVIQEIKPHYYNNNDNNNNNNNNNVALSPSVLYTIGYYLSEDT